MVVISVLIASVLMPFSVFAEQIQGFDYTNYYELEYIQGDGSAYIDTSFADASKNTKYSGKFEIGSGTGVIYGAGMGTNSGSYYQLLWLYSHSGDDLTYRIRTSTYGSTMNKSFSDGEGSQVVFDVSQSSITFNTFSGVTIYSNGSPSSGTSTVTRSIYVFANHSSSGAVNIFDGKIYWLKIENTSSGTVNRYLIPAERKSDGVYGMYDVQNSTFYTNAGSGSFIAGPRMNTTYTITTSVSPSGAGNVTGGGTFNSGATVTLTATPNTGYEFVRWSDNVTDNPRSFVATSNLSLTAVFQQSGTPVTTYTVTTNVSPSGAGSVSGGGTYDENTSVTLTASPVNGYAFSSWSNGVTSNPYTFTLTSDVTITATFVSSPTPSTYTVTLNPSPASGGTVSGAGSYSAGSNATLTAVANAGYTFVRWSDNVTTNPRNIQVNSDISLTAYFQRDYSHGKVIGTNIYLIDVEDYQVYEYRMDETSDGSFTYYRIRPTSVYTLSSIDSDYIYSTYLMQFDVVFNDDYMGEMSISVYNASNSSYLFTQSLYVNGSSVSFTREFFNQYPDIAIQYNTNNLVKKQTVITILQDGTTDSNEAVQEAESDLGDFEESRDDLLDIEDSLTDNMDDALNDISVPSDPLSGFGGYFLNSAVWVRTQFDRLTENTPYGSLLMYGLYLGLALLVMGKVML